MAVQVNVFMQNQPGRLAGATKVLSEKGINIRATTIASSEGFGVAKFLVNKPREAFDALKTAGLPVSLRDVVAVRMGDSSGSLDKILPVLIEKEINVNDAYGFVLERGKEAVFVFEVEKTMEVEQYLREKGCSIMSEQDLYNL